ncbi:hypothetical protein E4U58_002043 [Claviceps cyperi]|nr:hypothetical protein E4U58_002043 [Claviceps cyperi]
MSPHSEETVLATVHENADYTVNSTGNPERGAPQQLASSGQPAVTPSAPRIPSRPPSVVSNSDKRGFASHQTNGHAVGDAHAAPYLNGRSNGHGINGFGINSPGETDRRPQIDAAWSSPYLLPAPLDVEYDLICVGFGPASLAVAVAMHDALACGRKLLADGSSPKVLFIEKQSQFAWHSGMLLPGAKMQISFVKDLATLRDPRSEFTFLNYLHRHSRLVDFTNLGTFLPARIEYEDYMRWCSSFFTRLVQFGQQVVSVSPNAASKGAARSFTVRSEDVATGQTHSYRGRHILIAAGGQPSLPKSFHYKHPRVIHSSQYANVIHKIFPKTSTPCRVVIVGAGQSAAEIFNNVASRYPNSRTHLIMRQEFLRPSDDSPFVNCVFNPEYIDSMFPKSAKYRNNLLTEARATNYGVVRLELIEALYERMYDQRRELGVDENRWPHRIMGGKQITSMESHGDMLQLSLQNVDAAGVGGVVDAPHQETIEADLVIAATGYRRDAHVGMLKDAWHLLPKAVPGGSEFSKGISGWNVDTEQGERKIAVGRDYKVKFMPGAVAEDAGIWLQGCCEGTHGLSDTLLSVLATRSGEMVDNIFGKQVE